MIFSFLLFVFILVDYILAGNNSYRDLQEIEDKINAIRKTMDTVYQLDRDISSLQSFTKTFSSSKQENIQETVLITATTVLNIPYIIYNHGECYEQLEKAGFMRKMDEWKCVFFYQEYAPLLTLYSDMVARYPTMVLTNTISTHGMIYEIYTQRRIMENKLKQLKGNEYAQLNTQEFLLVYEMKQTELLKRHMELFL